MATCILCPITRPDTSPREPHQPPVCDSDRQLLDRWLGDITIHTADLTNSEPAIIDNRRYQRFTIRQGRIHNLGTAWADPVAALGGVAPINSRPAQPDITGSRERPIPVNTAALDLTAPARTPSTVAWPEDQIGHLSAATILDAWCRDIRHQLLPDHHLPPATVGDMVGWLRARTDLICDHYPAVTEYAEAIRNLRGALRATAGETEPQPQRCVKVPCRRCDLEMLYRHADGDVRCANPDCQTVMRGDEYAEWVKVVLVDTHHKQQQHGEPAMANQ